MIKLAQIIVPGNIQCSCIVLWQHEHQHSNLVVNAEGLSTLQRKNSDQNTMYQLLKKDLQHWVDKLL